MAEQPIIRLRLSIGGIVQGVGFRPFVYGLAQAHGLTGWVENDDAGVTIEVQGSRSAVRTFARELSQHPPPLAQVDFIEEELIEIRDNEAFLSGVPAAADRLRAGSVPAAPDESVRVPGELVPGAFVIAPSASGRSATTLVSPDVATCDDCLADIADPGDRRFGYEFTNCTNCGPRYSIVTGIPYDRPNTTMARFALCGPCRDDYEDPRNRRFHAQPVCCPRCGPALSRSRHETVDALRRGEIVAIKGVGGYHLTVRAADAEAVGRLRARKRREDKPFAVMVATIEQAEAICRVSPAERALLCSPARPVVLLERREGAPVADAVAPCTRELGVMLPYSPLHHLLLDELGEAMVCTSANLTDEPIAYDDEDARLRLRSIADAFLSHDRPIHIRVEDSVTRVVDGHPSFIRRSRGYAPAPLRVPWASPRPVLAVGAGLKNTIAYGRGHHVFLSHHIGDLDSAETYGSFLEAVRHLRTLFDIEPQLVARDLHPQYRSSTYADELGLHQVLVQHHHAHVAACMADAQHPGPVIGVAFDGIGYGADGTIWGGEFLLADLRSFERLGWFSPVPMPGGDAATRAPWRMAASYLDRLGIAATQGAPAGAATQGAPAGAATQGAPAGAATQGAPAGAATQVAPAGTATQGALDIIERNPAWDQVVQIARSGVNAPLTSSVGRLFDAAAALLDVRDVTNYEGQAAIELEQLADRAERAGYRARVQSHGSTHVVQGQDLIAALLQDRTEGVSRERIAMRLHRGIATAVLDVCGRIRDASGVGEVALTGGVFLNVTLLRETGNRLEQAGFRVLRHRRVPCNDGGISFGQAVVAAARDRAGELVVGTAP